MAPAIKNLTDKRYFAGLRQGIYAGPERSFEVGAKYTFGSSIGGFAKPAQNGLSAREAIDRHARL